VRYNIRFRHGRRASTLLIFEDESGVAYLLHCGELRRSLAGTDAAHRLMRHLNTAGSWSFVPAVSPYSLEELRELVAESDRVPVA
jgi:hypothetical protein